MVLYIAEYLWELACALKVEPTNNDSIYVHAWVLNIFYSIGMWTTLSPLKVCQWISYIDIGSAE